MKEGEAYIIIAHIEHRGEPSDSRLIYEWINASERNRAEYYSIIELYALRNAVKFSAETDDAVRRFNAVVDTRNSLVAKKRACRLLTFTSSIAASLAIVLMLIGATELRQQFQWYTYATRPDDAVRQLHLSDGTRVYLNRSSEISFRGNFNSRKRNVKLKGEAYFEVTPDPARPFSVSAGEIDVMVLGTSFNVKTGRTIETVLEKGRVELRGEYGRLLADMLPGQMASYNTVSDALCMETTNTSRHTSWRFDLQVYESVSLNEIFDLIEERYGVSVSMSDDLNDQSRYRLVVRNDESLEQLMETLKYIASIDYSIEKEMVLIQRKTR